MQETISAEATSRGRKPRPAFESFLVVSGLASGSQRRPTSTGEGPLESTPPCHSSVIKKGILGTILLILGCGEALLPLETSEVASKPQLAGELWLSKCGKLGSRTIKCILKGLLVPTLGKEGVCLKNVPWAARPGSGLGKALDKHDVGGVAWSL